MKCHYIKVKGVGKVLIPECDAVAISRDIKMCTCHNTTYAEFEQTLFKKEVERLKGIISNLNKENEFYRQLLEQNEINYEPLTTTQD